MNGFIVGWDWVILARAVRLGWVVYAVCRPLLILHHMT